MEGSVKASGVKVGTVGRGEGVGNGEGGTCGVVENDIVGREIGVAVGMALCVSASAVLNVDMAVSTISA